MLRSAECQGVARGVRSLVGFACTVAYRNGMDKARAIIRERVLGYAEDCLSTLTPEQRYIVERRSSGRVVA